MRQKRGINRFRASIRMESGSFFTMKTGDYDAAENATDLLFEDNERNPPVIDSEDYAELSRFFRTLSDFLAEASKKDDDEEMNGIVNLNDLR